MSAGDVDGLVTALTAEADAAVHYSLLRRLVAYLADPFREFYSCWILVVIVLFVSGRETRIAARARDL